MRSKALGIAVAVLLAGVGSAQPGQVLTFRSSADGSEQPYAFYAPAIEAGKTYPLVVSLHMEQSTHLLNLRQVLGADQMAAVRYPGAVVVCPLARGTMGYAGIAEQDVYDAVADAQRRFPIDPERVYLTGISMGGAAALRMAMTRPDVWAAVAAVCPTSEPNAGVLAGNALDLPVRIYQGDQDPVAPVASARAWQRKLLDLGVAADYVEYPGVRHNAWVLAYRGGAAFDWFGQFRRNRTPDRVRLTADSYAYASAYWVRIDGLTPGVPAAVDAVRRAPTEIAVQTRDADGFTLTPGSPVSLVTIDGTPLRVRAGTPLSFQKTAGKWRAGLLAPAEKRAGAEGPIVDAVRGRQLYVYGTEGSASEDQIAARKKQAEQAAVWSEAPGPLRVSFPVKADRAVTDEDLARYDLVLFGSRDTNTLIARFAPRLPLELNPGAADYGLLFVASVAGHYVLVSSGLPWWTGAEEARRGGWGFAPPQLRLLSTFGDYILFKGSLAHVVAEGRFDRAWKLPQEAREKIAASGTVTIR
jgi:poly(3-hydroxybutyrate) depolymerase